MLVEKLQFAEGRGGSFPSPDKEGGWQTWTYLLEEIQITGKVNMLVSISSSESTGLPQTFDL